MSKKKMISRQQAQSDKSISVLQCTDTRFLLVGENPRNSSMKNSIRKTFSLPWQLWEDDLDEESRQDAIFCGGLSL